jgi:hypothetical protein
VFAGQNPREKAPLISLCEPNAVLVYHALLKVALSIPNPPLGKKHFETYTVKVAARAIVGCAANGATIIIMIALVVALVGALFYVDAFDTRTPGCLRGSIENIFISCTLDRLRSIP